jgi:hypothetical protein
MRLSPEAARLVQNLYGLGPCKVAFPIWNKEIQHLTSAVEAHQLVETFSVSDSVRNTLFGLINQAVRLERGEKSW